MRLAIFIDKDRCVGCHACIVACKLEHNLPPYPTVPPLGNPKGPELIRLHQVGLQMREGQVLQYFQPISCMHCPDAPCIPACPHSAIYQDIETGVTLVQHDSCEGCRSCLAACPYEVPQFLEDKLVLCNLCIHRIGEGRGTACEAACPARAIHVGTATEISAIMAGRLSAWEQIHRSLRVFG